MKKLLLYLSIAFAGTGCFEGGEGAGGQFQNKNLALTVSGSRSFNTAIIHGRIDTYQLTVTADDLHIPFVQKFGGKSDSARMTGIPPGPSRTLTVEAVNPNGLVIRRGIKEGVTIFPGEFSHVQIIMNSVPIFTNIHDKMALQTNRVQFEIFAEPDSRVEILKLGSDGELLTTLIDRTANHALVNTAANEEGIYTFSPPPFPFGHYRFLVRDRDTQEASEVALLINDVPLRPGMALNAGGHVFIRGDELIYGAAGQFTYRPASVGGDHLGLVTLLDILDLSY